MEFFGMAPEAGPETREVNLPSLPKAGQTWSIVVKRGRNVAKRGQTWPNVVNRGQK